MRLGRSARLVVIIAAAAIIAPLAITSPSGALLPGEWSVPAPIAGDPNQPRPELSENGFQWGLAPAGGTGYPLQLFALRLEVPGNLVDLGLVSPVPFSYGFAGVEMPAGTKVSNITALSMDTYYEQSTAGGGTCGGGSPRYQLLVDVNDSGEPDAGDANVFVYVGAYPQFDACPYNTWTSNNLMDGALRWDSTQLGGPFYGTQAQANTQAAGHNVLFVSAVWDSWWKFAGRSIVWADNLRVNGFLLHEPALGHLCSLLVGQGLGSCPS